MAKAISGSQQTGKRIPMSEKKPSYDICVRGSVPVDLVNLISEIHAKAILLTRTSILEIQDGPAIPGDDKVQSPLRSVPAKKSVLNSEESQE